jgi:DNA-directed RNA polymerase specialized sigma24 family protein
MSYGEIGEVVDMSESAAKNKFWRTKEKLKEMLGPYMMDLEKHL